MKINQIYDYLKLERETSETGFRQYIEPNGNRVPSVTTILSATAQNDNLIRWQERVGLIEANRIRDEAAGLGSLMHDHLEKFVKGIVRPGGNNVVRLLAKNMADQIINRGLVNVDELWGSEISLYYPSLFGGTTDAIGIVYGKPSVIDFKTTKKMKTWSQIEDYRLQVAAYALSHNVLYNTDINHAIIYMVDRDMNFQEFIIDEKEFEISKKEWLNRLGRYFSLFPNN